MLHSCIELPDGLPCWLYWGRVKSSKKKRSWFDPVIYQKNKQSVFICEDSQITTFYIILCVLFCVLFCFFSRCLAYFPQHINKNRSPTLDGRSTLTTAWAERSLRSTGASRGWAAPLGHLKKAIGWGKVSINNMDFTDLPSGYLTVRHGKIHHF